MRRREFITLISGAMAAWSLDAIAQLGKKPIRIGLLPFGSSSNVYDQSLVEAFRSGLRQAGLIEGQDIVLDIVWTTGSDADTDKAVAELIRRGAELLVPTGSTASVAAKRHTFTIPIVFISVGNPVAMGLVENLAHPGGNATGFSDIFSDLSAKLVSGLRSTSNKFLMAPSRLIFLSSCPPRSICLLISRPPRGMGLKYHYHFSFAPTS